MGTAASLITPPVITTPPLSALAVATPDIVSPGRVLSSAPTAPLANAPVADDTQGHAPVIVTASNNASPSSFAQGVSGTFTGNLNSSGPSASFLAQLYGQGGDPDNVALATNFARFAPAPIYNAFVQYGYIKYRPSDAGIPQQSSSADSAPEQTNSSADTVVLQSTKTPAENDNALPSVVANDYQAYSQTQSRNQSNLGVTGQQITVSG